MDRTPVDIIDIAKRRMMDSGWSFGYPCPARLRVLTLRPEAGTIPVQKIQAGPGSAAHTLRKGYALRCVRGTDSYVSETFFGPLPLPRDTVPDRRLGCRPAAHDESVSGETPDPSSMRCRVAGVSRS